MIFRALVAAVYRAPVWVTAAPFFASLGAFFGARLALPCRLRFHDPFLPDFLPGRRRPAELRPGRGTFPIMS